MFLQIPLFRVCFKSKTDFLLREYSLYVQLAKITNDA